MAGALGDNAYLDGDRFTAGDLLMSSVLRIVPDLVTSPNLKAYVELCTGRPAFHRALQAQLADFKPDDAMA